MDEETWADGTEKLRHQRKVIILDPGHAPPRASLCLVGDSMRKAEVDRAVSLPEFRAVLEMVDEHVAERPQRAIGKAVVIGVDFAVFEPNASQRVRLFAGRHLDASGFVRRFSVGGTRAPRHPRAVNSSHSGIERRDEAARGLPHFDPVDTPNVLVRLAIRDENELAVLQMLKEIRHEVAEASNGHAPSEWYQPLRRRWRERWNALRLALASINVVFIRKKRIA